MVQRTVVRNDDGVGQGGSHSPSSVGLDQETRCDCHLGQQETDQGCAEKTRLHDASGATRMELVTQRWERQTLRVAALFLTSLQTPSMHTGDTAGVVWVVGFAGGLRGSRCRDV